MIFRLIYWQTWPSCVKTYGYGGCYTPISVPAVRSACSYTLSGRLIICQRHADKSVLYTGTRMRSESAVDCVQTLSWHFPSHEKKLTILLRTTVSRFVCRPWLPNHVQANKPFPAVSTKLSPFFHTTLFLVQKLFTFFRMFESAASFVLIKFVFAT